MLVETSPPPPFQLYPTYFAILLVHAGQVDLADERDLWRRVGVAVAANDLERVDAILMHTLQALDQSPAA